MVEKCYDMRDNLKSLEFTIYYANFRKIEFNLIAVWSSTLLKYHITQLHIEKAWNSTCKIFLS